MTKYSLLFALTLYLSFVPLVRASTGLTISPATLEVLIQPNKKLLQTVTVTNPGEPTVYQVGLYPLIPLGENGGSTLDLTHELDQNSLPAIFTLNNQPITGGDYTLPTGTTTFTLGIDTASGDTLSELYLALTFRPKTSPGSQVSAIPTIGLPLLLTITPAENLDFKLELENFGLPYIHDSMTSLRLSPTLKNTSTHMIRPTGELQITSPSGAQTTHTLTPNLILKDTVRALKFDTPPTLSPSISRFGPYKFSLVVKTSGGKEIISSTKVVWFLPLRLLILLLGAGLLLASTSLYLKKKHNLTHTSN